MEDNIKSVDKIPAHCELNGHWQLDLRAPALIAMTTIGILMGGISLLFGIIIREVLRGPWDGYIYSTVIFSFPSVLITVIAVVIVHEAIHGILFLISGCKPRFGFELSRKLFPIAYATSGVPISRDRYVLVSLGPLLILTLVFLVIIFLANNDDIIVSTLLALAMNVTGSIGDLIMVWKIGHHDRKTLFLDTKDGFDWYIPSR